MITQDAVDRLAGFDAGGLPVVSVYVPVQPEEAGRGTVMTYVDSLVHRIRATAGDAYDGDRRARLSVRDDLNRLRVAAERDRWPVGTAAVFACSGAGLFEAVALPRTIRDRFMVNTTPWVRPMLTVLDEYHRCCVVVTDDRSSELWELYQDELEEMQLLRDRALRDTDFAGWQGYQEHTVHNKEIGLARKHYRRLADELDQLQRDGRYDVLAVGGHRDEVAAFVKGLSKELSGRLAGTFSVDPSTATRADIRRLAGELLEDYEREEERRLVAQAMERAAAGGAAVVGVEACLAAGPISAIGTLLVQAEALVPGVVCDQGHWLARSGERCPLCGNPVRATDDVLDELAELVIDQGGAIEHVEAQTPLSVHLAAADLRFALPQQGAGATGAAA
jgi:hypothetical protein